MLLNILHAKGLRIGKIFQEWTTLFKIILIFLFIIIAFLSTNHQDISILPGVMILDFSSVLNLLLILFGSLMHMQDGIQVYIVGEIIQPEKMYLDLFSLAQ